MHTESMPSPLAKSWQWLSQQSLLFKASVLSTVGWFVFFVYSVAYCKLYLMHAFLTVPTVVDSCIWLMREYGPWPVITPVLWVLYSALWQQRKLLVLFIGVLAAVLHTAFRVAVDVLFGDANMAASIVSFYPTHVVVSAFVFFSWYTLLRPQLVDEKETAQPTEVRKVSPKPMSLTVDSGLSQLQLPVSEIESISAAGNYMEVCTGEKQYILRATMKELESKLAEHGFVRVHRSFLANRNAMEKVMAGKSIRLKSQREIPLGQKYKKELFTSMA